MPQRNEKLPEIIVFAGPNGSGKSTITKMAKVIEGSNVIGSLFMLNTFMTSKEG